MLNRAPAMECSARESLWYNSVHRLQDQRGKNREIIQALQSCSTILPEQEMKMTYCHHWCKSPPISTEWPMTSTLLPSPVRASLSWLWWVIMVQPGPIRLRFHSGVQQQCYGSCDLVTLKVWAMRHLRPSWLMTCVLLRSVPLSQLTQTS